VGFIGLGTSIGLELVLESELRLGYMYQNALTRMDGENGYRYPNTFTLNTVKITCNTKFHSGISKTNLHVSLINKQYPNNTTISIVHKYMSLIMEILKITLQTTNMNHVCYKRFRMCCKIILRMYNIIMSILTIIYVDYLYSPITV